MRGLVVGILFSLAFVTFQGSNVLSLNAVVSQNKTVSNETGKLPPANQTNAPSSQNGSIPSIIQKYSVSTETSPNLTQNSSASLRTNANITLPSSSSANSNNTNSSSNISSPGGAISSTSERTLTSPSLTSSLPDQSADNLTTTTEGTTKGPK